MNTDLMVSSTISTDQWENNISEIKKENGKYYGKAGGDDFMELIPMSKYPEETSLSLDL